MRVQVDFSPRLVTARTSRRSCCVVMVFLLWVCAWAGLPWRDAPVKSPNDEGCKALGSRELPRLQGQNGPKMRGLVIHEKAWA